MPSWSPPQEWREFFFCAFAEQNWGRFKWAGQRAAGGPVIYDFCSRTFAGDPGKIRCCSNARCPWGNSPTPVYGHGIGVCVSPKWAVNICCPPCFCKVADPRLVPISGVVVDEASGLISRVAPGGRSSGGGAGHEAVPIALAYPCDKERGLFAPRALLGVDEVLQDVDCKAFDDPMEIGGGGGWW